jgi:alpha-galactosidase
MDGGGGGGGGGVFVLVRYWASILSNLDDNMVMAPIAAPGFYNDPDMLVVGHAGFTDNELRSHVGGWAVSAAPLLISTDLRALAPDALAVLHNVEVLAIDQDPAVVQGVRVSPKNATGLECWARPLTPPTTVAGVLVTVVFLFNRGDAPSGVASCSFAELGLDPSAQATALRDVWGAADLPLPTGRVVSVDSLPPHASVLLKLTTAQ